MHTETKGVDVAGHRLHQMLVVFPLGLLAGAVIFDIVHLANHEARWGEISFWLIAAGVIAALVAAVFGAIDWYGIPRHTQAKKTATVHGVGNVIVVALFVISWFVRMNAPQRANAASYVLDFVGLGIAVFTGWLGGELITRMGVGVHSELDLDAPPSVRNPRYDHVHDEHAPAIH